MPRPAKTIRGPDLEPLAEVSAEPGRFVVVATAAPAMRDLMLTAIRRRLVSRREIQFPMLAAEMRHDRLVREGVLALSRAQFRAFEAEGAFAAVWSEHGVRMGLPREAVAALCAGATLVVPGPATLAIDARRWTNRVSIVGIAPDVDRVRQRLSPKACLSRLVAPRMRRHIEGLSIASGPEFAVSVGPDIGRSISELTAAIVAGGD